MKRAVLFIGPPGCGKGTQSLYFTATYKLSHISSGDLFRHNIESKTPLGQEAVSFIEKGELVPDSTVIGMIQDHMKSLDTSSGYLFDGFPRTISQARNLMPHLKNCKVSAINFIVSDEIIIERISHRLLCSECSAPYHTIFAPPKNTSKCDICNGSLYQRKDDTADVVLNRLHVFKEQTFPIIQFFEDQGVLHSIDASQDKDTIRKSIENALCS